MRRGDQIWQVPFKEQAQAEGYPRFLLLNLEFQSRRDGFMALRFLEYGNELYREVRAQGVVGEGEPCPVLCILQHNGGSPWTAPTSAAATLSVPAALGRAVVPPGLVAFHPWGYFPLDFVAHRDRPHIPGDIISMMVGIEFAKERADLVAPLWETVRQLSDDELRDTVARWLRRMDAHYNLNLPGLQELLAMEDVTELTSRLDETIEGWRRDALMEGENRGAARSRALLLGLASQRFGVETAERLDGLLGAVSDWDQLASVGESIIDANSGIDLTDRIAALMRS